MAGNSIFGSGIVYDPFTDTYRAQAGNIKWVAGGDGGMGGGITTQLNMMQQGALSGAGGVYQQQIPQPYDNESIECAKRTYVVSIEVLESGGAIIDVRNQGKFVKRVCEDSGAIGDNVNAAIVELKLKEGSP